MSAYSASHDSWLSLKHRTKPSCVYSFACGDRDSDWDFADTPSRGYSFATEDTPIQLLNNSGGMDEDDIPAKNVWYPYQATASAPIVAEEEMSSGDDMDMDMDTQQPTQMIPQQQPQHQYIQQQPQHQQQFEQQQFAQPTVNKRKRGAESLEMNSGMTAYEYQQMSFDGSKRVRVGA